MPYEEKIVIFKNLNIDQKNNIINFIIINFDIEKYELDIQNETIIIIILDNKRIIGCVCIVNNHILKNLINNKIYFNMIDNISGLFVYNLCVDKNYRNKGIGTELIKSCINLLELYKIDYIHSHAENEASKKIFIKNNFIIDNTFYSLNSELIHNMIYRKNI